MHRRAALAVTVLALAVAVSLIAYALYARSGGGSGLRVYAEKLSTLDGLRAVKILEGPEAVQTVTGIHFNPSAFNPEDALIIVYSDGSRLWVTRVRDACSLVERMAERMAELSDRLPYTPPRAETVGGTTFYVSVDKRDGSIHIFWCKGDLAVWLEARSREMLQEGLHRVIETLG